MSKSKQQPPAGGTQAPADKDKPAGSAKEGRDRIFSDYASL